MAPEFQGFDEEVRSLPGLYAPPAGRLLLAIEDGLPAGTAALRPVDRTRCEAKRLYVRPEFRGRGIAKALLATLVEEARLAGYTEMLGDTLISMKDALRLYQEFGFSETGPYSANPTPGAIYLKMRL